MDLAVKIPNIYNVKNSFLFFTLLILFAVVDNINGYLQSVGLVTPIAVLFRGGILALLFPRAFSKSKNWIQYSFIFLIILYLLCFIYWMLNSSNFSISQEIDYLFRMVYFFTLIMYVYNRRKSLNFDKVFKIISHAAFILGVLNIFCFITGLGVHSYGEDYGFGTKAFYKAGNDFSIYLIMSIPIIIWYGLACKKIRYLVMSVIVSIGALLVGTRSAMIGAVLPWLMIFIYLALIDDRYIILKRSTRVIVSILVSGFILLAGFASVSFISKNADAYTLSRLTLESAISPREKLINAGEIISSSREGLTYFIGDGFSSSISQMGDMLGLEAKTVEADNKDLILNFGYGLGALFVLFYLYLYLRCFVYPFMRRANSLSFTFLIIGTMWYGVSLMAGHGFLNMLIIPLIALYISANEELNYKS